MIFKNISNKPYLKHPNAVVFWLLFLALYFPIVSFLLVSIGLLGFIFWPFQSYDVNVKNTPSQSVTVISHGLKDDNRSWVTTLEKQLLEKDNTTSVIGVDWSRFADNALTCSVNGRRIGNNIAHLLLSNPNLKNIKLIGHSCGAFVNYGICEVITQSNTNITIKSIYLDPVSIYGGLFWDFGINKFGSCADQSITYFDTDDNVPGSNRAPIHSFGVDVTNYKRQFKFEGSPHQWPIYYYISINE